MTSTHSPLATPTNASVLIEPVTTADAHVFRQNESDMLAASGAVWFCPSNMPISSIPPCAKHPCSTYSLPSLDISCGSARLAVEELAVTAELGVERLFTEPCVSVRVRVIEVVSVTVVVFVLVLVLVVVVVMSSWPREACAILSRGSIALATSLETHIVLSALSNISS